MFRKFILAAVLAVASTASFGAVIDTTGLNDAQIAELKAHAARAVADVAKGAPVTAAAETTEIVTMAATWGQQAATAAEGFARAINIAAKELGVTVNDFLGTDAGKLTAVLIIWKVAGESILGIMYAGFFVTAGLTLARVIYLRLFCVSTKEVQYNYLFGMFKGTKIVRVAKGISELDEEGEWLMLWVMIIVTIGTILIGAALV